MSAELETQTPIGEQIFQPIRASADNPARRQLEEILLRCDARGASDVHLTTGLKPFIRVLEYLRPLESPELTGRELEAMALSVMNEGQLKRFRETKQLDLAIFIDGGSRYRINVFLQRGTIAMAIRRLPQLIPSFDDLILPREVAQVSEFPYGLVLVTGPTGSGKSTTLAAILNHINQSRSCHILTIEDPIEYVHRNARSLVRQRELFTDVGTYHDALRAALREDPDVILVGEMRDQETVEAAVTAADTGHLVFSTLHTGDCVDAIGRVCGVYPLEKQDAIRDQLSRLLRCVISQRLVRTLDGTRRAPVLEVMRINLAIANMIRQGDLRQIYSVLQAEEEGMLLLEKSLACLVFSGLLDLDEAYHYCRDRSILQARLRTLERGATSPAKSY